MDNGTTSGPASLGTPRHLAPKKPRHHALRFTTHSPGQVSHRCCRESLGFCSSDGRTFGASVSWAPGVAAPGCSRIADRFTCYVSRMGTNGEHSALTSSDLPKLHTVNPGTVFTSSDGRVWQAGSGRWELRATGAGSGFARNRRRAHVLYGVTVVYLVVLIFTAPLIDDYWGRVFFSLTFVIPLACGFWFSLRASKSGSDD